MTHAVKAADTGSHVMYAPKNSEFVREFVVYSTRSFSISGDIPDAPGRERASVFTDSLISFLNDAS